MAAAQPQPWHPKNFIPAKNPKNVPPGWQYGTIDGKRVGITPPPKGRKRGDVVSYGKYLDAQARESGLASHRDYRKKKKVIDYFRNTYSQLREGTAKKEISLGGENLRLLVIALYGPDKDNMAPGGPMAQFLEAIGWRARGAQYAVGETP